MKLLLLFPNTANWASISTAIPILNKIARMRGWTVEYFDTYNYEKPVDSNSEKEQAAGFKPGYSTFKVARPFSRIVPDLQETIDRFRPDLIAVTGLSCDYDFLMTFLPTVRLPSEDTRVVIGGVHAILARDEVIETRLFDLVTFGEAESIFPDILARVEARESLAGIEGTYAYDRRTRTILKYPRRRLLSAENLWLVGGDYSIFDDAYFVRPFDGRMIRRVDVEVGRGCPYNCTYCGNSALKDFHRGLGSYVKSRPVSSSIEEMKALRFQRGIEMFQFTDECFLSRSTQWLTDFLERYKAEINVPFIFQTRPETVSQEKIDLLLSYEIPFQISIGVESGAEHILNGLCERMCTNDQIVNAFDILNNRHIRTNAFFMIGFPFETREDVFRTIELFRRIMPSVAMFQPLFGQKIRDICIEQGFITGKEPAATFTSHSLLNMPKPYLSATEIHNLWRTFVLYGTLPKEYYGDIEKCEKHFDENQELFDRLVHLRWDRFDYAKGKGDMPLCK